MKTDNKQKGKKEQKENKILELIENIINGIGGFLSERQDILNKLEDHGIEITEDKIRLLKKRRKYTESDQILLKQLTEEIIINRQEKLQNYRRQIANAVKKIKEARIKINEDAIKELKSDQKAFKKAMRIQYGFWRSLNIINEKNSSKNFEEIMNKKIEYYKSISNIQLLEQMCYEIPVHYKIETKAFIDVLLYLKKISRSEENIIVINQHQKRIEDYLEPEFA